MKVTKRSFSFSMKLSENYDSVSVGESFEVELQDSSALELDELEQLKNGMIGEVKERVEAELKNKRLPKEQKLLEDE